MTAEQSIIARMSSGEPFTYRDLWQGQDEGRYERTHRLVQEWKANDWISYARFSGIATVWHITEAGREYAQSLTDEGQAAVSEGRV